MMRKGFTRVESSDDDSSEVINLEEFLNNKPRANVKFENTARNVFFVGLCKKFHVFNIIQ